ncbi:IclR family transcriptional regulator [Arthrobacter sp. FW306-04-A]|uniref:IclR family transcriptional regulator n=1 Tax=Arthrobacter sp. FW306-04-A TaxID=2879619 RepID=UPI0037BF0F47|nr:IclR family transcriptional regulator [Arthrobacter sp. FW306-04-A]
MTLSPQPLPGADAQSPLQTVDRALGILLSFNEFRTDWGVLELAETFGLTKSSAQRLLASLAAQGFLRADPWTRRYSLGPAMWRMASLWERTGGLARLADTVLTRLSQETTKTTLFAIPDGAYVRCIAAIDGLHGPLRAHPLIGDLYPAHAGATSRSYFAFLSPAERRNLLHGRPHPRFSEHTEVDEQRLEALFDQTVTDGYAFSEGEYDPSTRALAVPVLLGHRPVGSLSISESKVQQDGTDLMDFLTQLLAAAHELSDLLSNKTTAPQRNWRHGKSLSNQTRPRTKA